MGGKGNPGSRSHRWFFFFRSKLPPTSGQQYPAPLPPWRYVGARVPDAYSASQKTDRVRAPTRHHYRASSYLNDVARAERYREHIAEYTIHCQGRRYLPRAPTSAPLLATKLPSDYMPMIPVDETKRALFRSSFPNLCALFADEDAGAWLSLGCWHYPKTMKYSFWTGYPFDSSYNRLMITYVRFSLVYPCSCFILLALLFACSFLLRHSTFPCPDDTLRVPHCCFCLRQLVPEGERWIQNRA